MSKRTQKGLARLSPDQPQVVSPLATAPNIIAEDGWLFIERPGQGFQCLRRYDQTEAATLTQPYTGRNNYPST
jgi:hypothetical protein